MRKLVRDTIEVRECESLDLLLERLQAVRASLPDPQRAQVKLRGDDVFGRLITIRYARPMTAEEAACEARYG